MFRVEGQAFSEAAELMQSVCAELNEYEDEIRALSRMWDRNPDLPAPRQKLRKSLENLEQRETSLNLVRRRLMSVNKLYEDAEHRIQDMAEETVESDRTYNSGADNPGADTSGKKSEEKAISDYMTEDRKKDFFFGWVWPFMPFRPVPQLILPVFPPVFPHLPRRLWPPRRPHRFIDRGRIRKLLLEFLRTWLPGGGGHPAKRTLIKNVPDLSEITLEGRMSAGVINLPVLGQTGIQTPQRQARRTRIETIFK